MIIAIDGPAGSGKTTTAKLVAVDLQFLHLDTGAMYRAITLKGIRLQIPYQDHARLGAMTRNTEIRFELETDRQLVFVDNEDVTDAIRSREVTRQVSDYCAVPVVREILVEQQRRIGRSRSSVLEGRDIGTVVFPDAQFKFYLVASIEERAKRRLKELSEKGVGKPLEELMAEIRERDHKDASRATSPLCMADDAIEIDTSHTSISEQVQAIVDRVKAFQAP